LIDDDLAPITLDEAVKLFPRARLTKSTLRAEADRGHLHIFRIGRRDHTTAKSMREMVRKCQDADHRRDCISIANAANGQSETDRASSARAALSQSVAALKSGLPHISAKSTRRSVDQTH
jgi:hypothetical protein